MLTHDGDRINITIVKKSNPIDALECAISQVGGTSALASMIGVSPSAPCMWRKRGVVPLAHCYAIEKATAGSVNRRDLRPDDWHQIWPDLELPEEPAHD